MSTSARPVAPFLFCACRPPPAAIYSRSEGTAEICMATARPARSLGTRRISGAAAMKHRRQLDLFVTTPEARGPLVGLAVQLPDSCRCGRDVVRIGPPVGPHLAELRCARCDRHRGWLPRAAHRLLVETVKQFGRPDTPICIRRGRGHPQQSAIAALGDGLHSTQRP
jgi:hypothetical protein